MSSKVLWRSWAGGEITPELAGRLDLTKYQTGLALCRNFITLPHGPVTRRPGFEHVNTAYQSDSGVRLIPFQFNADQSVVLEFGQQYVRFHINGGTLLLGPVAIASISGNTVTTSVAHNYFANEWVFIGGRYFVIGSVPTATTFTTLDTITELAATPSGTEVRKVYTLSTPYQVVDLADLKHAQSADVLTLTHPNYPAHELARLGATNWTLTAVSFAPPSNPPTGVAVAATIGTSTNLSPQSYVVTAVQPDGVTESLPSASVSTNNNLSLAGNYNTITWNPVDGCERYNVYKKRGGVFGYIGQVQPTAGTTKTIGSATRPLNGKTVTVVTTTNHGFSTGNVVFITGVHSTMDGVWSITVINATTFTYVSRKEGFRIESGGTASIPSLSLTDDNVTADTTSTPPDDIISLNTTEGEYPSAVTYHEQRRWFAGTTQGPQVLWATRTGTDSNLTSSIPSREADAMELRIAATQYNQIRHLVPLADLIALTAGGEFRIYADGAPAITPTSVSIKPQGYAGANTVQPVLTSGSVLYVQAQGSRVREMAYNWESNAYRSIDISIMAPHRFNGYTITQLAYSRAPDQIAWAVRNDGALLGLTYVPDQQVFAWHAHDTAGLFRSVCVVSEGNEDVLYAAIERTASNGTTVMHIERLRTRVFDEQMDAFFVDAGLTYRGAPVSAVSGLWHLEGKDVQILADGAVVTGKTVTNGTVTLDYPAGVITVGLGYTSDIKTLPLALESMQAAGQGTTKNVNRVHLRVSQSSVLKVGPAFDRLREHPARSVADNYGSPPALSTGEVSVGVDAAWSQDGSVCVRQDLPLPLTVLSMTLEVQTGG